MEGIIALGARRMLATGDWFRDSHSSLCFYLNREARRWELMDPPPPNPIYLVLAEDERRILAMRTDVEFAPLKSVKSPRAEQTYTLGIANHVSAIDPIGS